MADTVRRSGRARKPTVNYQEWSDSLEELSPRPAKRQKVRSPPQQKKAQTPEKEFRNGSGCGSKDESNNVPDETPKKASKESPGQIPTNGCEDVPKQVCPDASKGAFNGESQAVANNGVGEMESPPPLVNLLKKLEPGEAETYEGWVELESEPAHFNYILDTLGVSGAKFCEIYCMDEGGLASLTPPVYGFVFLYECDEEDDSNLEAIVDPKGIWYAKQLSSNSCASVALLNILMNAQGIELGTQLKHFKKQTAELPPPIRGFHLANNAFIRTAHNSFARRIDLISEDLVLRNMYDEDDSKAKRKAKSKLGQAKLKKRKAFDTAKHFIAYIPVDGRLWQLDGLEKGAVCLGEYQGDWTHTALLQIQAKAATIGGLNVTLLALCHNPTTALRRAIAVNIAKLVLLQEETDLHPDWEIYRGDQQTWVDGTNDEELAALGLSVADIKAAIEGGNNGEDGVSQSFVDRIASDDLTAQVAMDIAAELEKQQKSLKAEYFAEVASLADDVKAAEDRRKDYTAAIHAWVTKLAEKGVLKELADEVVAQHAALVAMD